MTRTAALLLTTLTGFSGLVYEVAWQRYLATLLGSHGEATAAVLGIFLGGLSLGYWLFGVVTRRLVTRAEAAGEAPRLLLVYGALEAGIGVYVLAFPWLFRGVQMLSYAIPHGAAGVGFAIDVLLATLLIGPASVLMGGTIPILTQALARSLEDATRFHAFVYAFNTAGAFVGALAAGFYLVPRLGLVNVMLAMGTINLFAGSVFALIGIRARAVVSLSQAGTTGEARKLEGFGAYAAVALLTGFALMTIQTAVIRIAGISFGSSQFTFSMVVAVFVLCIALGSFAVSALSRIPTIYVVLNQWGIALFFLALYARLPESPYWVHVIRTLFRDTDAAFVGFYVLSFALVLLVIGLPVMLSGAALPLLFHHMRREIDHLGDLAGSLYSWNTVGSLFGALLGGYALFFWLDLHHIYRVAIAALVIAAVMLSMRVYGWRPLGAAAALVPLLAAIALLPKWDPELLHGTEFLRHPEPSEGTYDGPRQAAKAYRGRFGMQYLFFADDPTTSVTVREHDYPDGRHSRSIVTNGKSDGDTRRDRDTNGLMAVLPVMMAEKAERVFVVGWGVGTTAGELGSFESVREVDVAEISRAVIAAAPFFDFANLQASKNPKIRMIRSDAYRALMRTEGTYDVIISQPSHLWVAGVEMLFSREFLEAARSKLSPGGVYLQWMQKYDIDRDSIAMVLRTYAEVYDHVAVWSGPETSLLLLGFLDPRSGTDYYRLAERAERPDYKATLERSDISSFGGLLTHELLPVGVVHAAELRGPLHTLYHPRLNDMAGRAFFRRAADDLPFTGFGEAARIGAKNSLLRRHISYVPGGLDDEAWSEIIVAACDAVGPRCQTLLARWMSEDPKSAIFERTFEWLSRNPQSVGRERLEEIARLFGKAGHSGGSTARPTASTANQATDDFVQFYHHAAPFPQDRLLGIWSDCRNVLHDEEGCRTWVRHRLLSSSRDFEDLMRECMSEAKPGGECRAGLEKARVLLDEGRRAP